MATISTMALTPWNQGAISANPTIVAVGGPALHAIRACNGHQSNDARDQSMYSAGHRLDAAYAPRIRAISDLPSGSTP